MAKETYRVGVEWALSGFYEVEAENFDEAVSLAEEMCCDETPLPDGYYIDGSIRVSGIAENLDTREVIEV